ncbi:hypothetical protein [Komagataeibacter swingsii]|uniref:hypothetical protein n=1 Tax=Komagataeibacter swingsii TaxID=215220 RepID=UPI0011B7C26B|nr:hypothetical protein [Komagataeibacter swingsii]GBQ60468.1 hypothetical protein AA16373_1886 [Komagataeibacter swingsii DSM 16373]
MLPNDVEWRYDDGPQDIHAVQPVAHYYDGHAGMHGFLCVLRGFAWMDDNGGPVSRNGQPVPVLMQGHIPDPMCEAAFGGAFFEMLNADIRKHVFPGSLWAYPE